MLLLTLMLAQISDDIVVRGKRTEEALAACIARDCPTPDDARLSIAHAETQFAQGQYHEARLTLSRAISRQKAHAAEFPRLVAALYEAKSTVELHRGDMDAYRKGIIGQTSTLREHLPDDDPQLLLTSILLGDFWAKNGSPTDALRVYNAAARGYARRGEGRLAALTTLRAASMDLALRNRGAAADRLDEVAGSPAASEPSVRQLHAVISARLALANGDEAGVDRLIATLRTDPANPPVLIKDVTVMADPLARARNDPLMSASILQNSQPSPIIRWVDIGFMVAPDGTVGDVEILRGSRSREPFNAYVAAVGKRRYAPIDLPVGSPGLYRIERFTLRPERVVPTGSFVRRPAGKVEVQIQDLTQDAPVPLES